MSCAILVLAGGAPVHDGTPRALLPWGDDCLINHLARLAVAAGGSPVLRVIGARAPAISARRAPLGVEDVFNLFWGRGSGRSVAVGLRAALASAPALEGVLLLACDKPLVTSEQLGLMLARVTETPDRIVQSDYGDGYFGAPVAFGRAYFADLISLDGEDCGRQIVDRHLRHRVTVAFPDGAWDFEARDDQGSSRTPNRRAVASDDRGRS